MKVEGTALFKHDTKPFGQLVFNAEIIPETTADHDALQNLRIVSAQLIWEAGSGRCWLQAVIAEPPATSVPDSTGDSTSLDKQLAEVDIDPEGETSPT